MAKKVMWGLLSTAHINEAVIGPMRKAARSELLAVASRDGARAKAYAAQHRIRRSYGSYEELLFDPDVDAV